MSANEGLCSKERQGLDKLPFIFLSGLVIAPILQAEDKSDAGALVSEQLSAQTGKLYGETQHSLTNTSKVTAKYSHIEKDQQQTEKGTKLPYSVNTAGVARA